MAADNAPKVCLPPLDCDPNRRLARYAAYFGGQQWECTGSPEQKARRDTNLIRYREYFDNPVAYKTTNESLDDSALIKLKWLD